jgi:hypothetical protein
MLYYQNVNSAWSNWAYSWTLILVFIGIGIIMSRAIQGNLSAGIREGGRLIVIGLILFAIFGSFLGLGLGISFVLAIVLIGIGIWMVARVFFKGKGTAAP